MAVAMFGALSSPAGAASTIPALDAAGAMAIQANGKVVVAGESYRGQGAIEPHMSVARVNVDGSLDQSFGDDGFNVLGAPEILVSDLVIQPDGRIVVLGHENLLGGDVLIARFTSSGQLDPTFGSGGLKFLSLGNTDVARGLVLQSSGKLVIATVTFTTQGSPGSLAIARLNASGSLDTSFDPIDGDGIVRAGDLTGDWLNLDARSIAVQADDSVVVAGNASAGPVTVGRLDPDGTADPSFGSGDGAVAAPLGTPSFSYDLSIADGGPIDGKIVVAWQSQITGAVELARLSPVDGSADASFDGEGRKTLAWGHVFVPGEGTSNGVRLALEPDGDAVVGRQIADGPDSDYAVARVTAAGVLDGGFGGVRRVDFGRADAAAAGIAVDASARIVVAGTAVDKQAFLDNDYANGADIGIARLSSSGPLDSSFDGDGKAIIGSTQTVAAIQGTPGADRITGTPGNDVIRAGKGNDVVNGGGGRDTIIGGPGKDKLNGQAGKDTLKGGAGKDKLKGGAGKDLLIGGPGLDVLIGGPGRDRQRQ